MGGDQGRGWECGKDLPTIRPDVATGRNVKFENIEAAIVVLRQACDYLYQGLKHVGSVTKQKADAEKMQNVTSAMGETVDRTPTADWKKWEVNWSTESSNSRCLHRPSNLPPEGANMTSIIRLISPVERSED